MQADILTKTGGDGKQLRHRIVCTAVEYGFDVTIRLDTGTSLGFFMYHNLSPNTAWTLIDDAVFRLNVLPVFLGDRVPSPLAGALDEMVFIKTKKKAMNTQLFTLGRLAYPIVVYPN